MKPVKLPPARLLELEDTDEILSFACPRTGVPLWSLIRWEVLGGLLQWTWADDDQEPCRARPSRARRGSHLLAASGRNALVLGRGTPASLLVVGNAAVRTTAREGRPFNPLTDYFVDLVPSSRAMEVPDLDNAGKGRSGVLDQYPMRAAARIAGRARRREATDGAQALVNWVRTRVEGLWGMEVPAAYLARWVRAAAEGSASLKLYESMWSALLRRLHVDIVIKIDGCYGGPENVSLVRAARNRRVLVAEHQHGVVNRAHLAYNFAPTVRGSAAFAETLPDVILTYGSWWHDSFAVPSRLVPVGHPHRQAMAPTLAVSEAARTDVLVLGNAIDTAASLSFCRELREWVPRTTVIVFRPHPGERSRAKELAAGPDLDGIRVDLSDDLYPALATARALVAEASTGLYEAVGLVPQIFVWGNEKGMAYSSDAPFDVATGAADLAAVLDRPGRGATPAGLGDTMWASDWEARFETFVSEHVVSGGATRS